MRFRIGEEVIYNNQIKTIKSFCSCCTKLLSNDEYDVKTYANVFFEDGGNTNANRLRKTGQLLFDFMYK